MCLMNIYLDVIRKELYKNIRNQIELQNNLTDFKKGRLVVKKRYNEEYYYLSYRQDNKVKTDYLGKLSQEEVDRYQKENEERNYIKTKLKELSKEEDELRRLILAVNKKALIKNVYDVMDLIVVLRPILIYSKAKEAYLFGSYARGEMNETSDINIELVGCKKDKKEIEAKIEKITGKVTNVLYNEEKIDLMVRETIDDEKILIYGAIF